MSRAAALMSLLLVGCGGAAHDGLQQLRGEAQGTTWTIKYTGAPRERLYEQVVALLLQFDLVFSLWLPDSEIRRFNADPQRIETPVSARLAAALRHALALAAATDGAFDPTLRPLLHLRGFGAEPLDRAPLPAELEDARARVGHRLLRVGADDVVVRERPGVQIDLDGIAQGIAVDELAALLQAAGLGAFMVELGGEVRCAGTKPDGTPWRIAIEAPPSDAAASAADAPFTSIVPLQDQALATSGNYRRFVESGGARKHHILDPQTGDSAASGLVSASVIAADCATADALATALMVLGPDRGLELLQRLGRDDLRALMVVAPRSAEAQAVRVPWRWP